MIPGDGVVGLNTPPSLTVIKPHDSSTPVWETPDDEFDEDGYALVLGGLVHKFERYGKQICIFYGYDGSVFEYESCE